MSFCPSCGKQLQRDARFCSECGATVAVAQPVTNSGAAVATAPAKRGGRLALKGFGLALLVEFIGIAASRNDISHIALSAGVGMGVGAAYIILSLRTWKKNGNPVKGAAIGWAIAILLLMGCLGGLASIGSGVHGNVTDTSTESVALSPKETLMRDVKLDYTWRKDGFGNVMIANFTLTNPTQYRFKDFEIKCTHFAPSGTEIDSNTRTIYQTVEPHSTKAVHEMNMGFIDSQAAKSACGITDLVPLD